MTSIKKEIMEETMDTCGCVKWVWSYSHWPYLQYTQEACKHGVRFTDGEESYKRFMELRFN